VRNVVGRLRQFLEDALADEKLDRPSNPTRHGESPED
jgi:hypothetical protein